MRRRTPSDTYRNQITLTCLDLDIKPEHIEWICQILPVSDLEFRNDYLRIPVSIKALSANAVDTVDLSSYDFVSYVNTDGSFIRQTAACSSQLCSAQYDTLKDNGLYLDITAYCTSTQGDVTCFTSDGSLSVYSGTPYDHLSTGRDILSGYSWNKHWDFAKGFYRPGAGDNRELVFKLYNMGGLFHLYPFYTITNGSYITDCTQVKVQDVIQTTKDGYIRRICLGVNSSTTSTGVPGHVYVNTPVYVTTWNTFAIDIPQNTEEWESPSWTWRYGQVYNAAWDRPYTEVVSEFISQPSNGTQNPVYLIARATGAKRKQVSDGYQITKPMVLVEKCTMPELILWSTMNFPANSWMKASGAWSYGVSNMPDVKMNYMYHSGFHLASVDSGNLRTALAGRCSIAFVKGVYGNTYPETYSAELSDTLPVFTTETPVYGVGVAHVPSNIAHWVDSHEGTYLEIDTRMFKTGQGYASSLILKTPQQYQWAYYPDRALFPLTASDTSVNMSVPTSGTNVNFQLTGFSNGPGYVRKEPEIVTIPDEHTTVYLKASIDFDGQYTLTYETGNGLDLGYTHTQCTQAYRIPVANVLSRHDNGHKRIVLTQPHNSASTPYFYFTGKNGKPFGLFDRSMIGTSFRPEVVLVGGDVKLGSVTLCSVEDTVFSDLEPGLNMFYVQVRVSTKTASIIRVAQIADDLFTEPAHPESENIKEPQEYKTIPIGCVLYNNDTNRLYIMQDSRWSTVGVTYSWIDQVETT